MGPQLYRCGNEPWRNYRIACTQRFNGAATLSLRKCLDASVRFVKIWSFNGAATLSLRKFERPMSVSASRMLLQWGRNFIVAEIQDLAGGRRLAKKLQWGRNFIVAEMFRYFVVCSKQVLASMGPQLYRCGNSPPPRTATSTSPCFNGAATLSLRKLEELQRVTIE